MDRPNGRLEADSVWAGGLVVLSVLPHPSIERELRCVFLGVLGVEFVRTLLLELSFVASGRTPLTQICSRWKRSLWMSRGEVMC